MDSGIRMSRSRSTIDIVIANNAEILHTVVLVRAMMENAKALISNSLLKLLAMEIGNKNQAMA